MQYLLALSNASTIIDTYLYISSTIIGGSYLITPLI